ncbi:YadA-like family protein [Mitsuokella jalaludinii]|uniref:YadA-like family protein n=1 Tax=Mitsuokella jalaludinii TaxID=187979 RepID=UPI0005642983|nr:YadA-like family protein [Mitsuokella jalaludinii]
MYKELHSGITSTTNTIDAGKTVAWNLNALDQAIGKATVNLSTLDTQVKSNADAIQNNTSNISTNTTNISANTTAIDNLRTSTTTNLATKADVNASNLTNLSDPDLTAWGTALGKGTIAAGNEKLVTGGMLHSELRPATDGTYVKNGNTTATNLTALDTQIKNVIDAIGLDPDNTTTSYTSKLNKYFKVNPKVTTTDTTTTYDPDAVANGTNSVAIGPNAKTATYTTTVTSDDSTTTTETAADHAVAIGDGATVNAAGDQGIALGKGAVTGEAEASTPDGTTTTTTDAKGGESSVAIGDSARANGNQALAFGKGASVLNPTGTGVSTGSTAIGSGAKVDGGSNSIALGTSAVVNTVSDAMALGNGATINKTAKESIAIGKGAVTGGVDKPITLTNGTTGTLAAAGGLDSIAIGNGAVSEGNEALALGKGAKVTNGATGGDSAAAIVKNGSAAIGDGAEVANSATSMAIGNGASITEGENTTVIGSGAKATQTKQAFVAGYQASSDSSAESSVAIGDNASTHSARTTAIGYKAEAHNADSIAIGSEAKTDDNGGGIAIGNKTSVAQGGIAIGNATQASNISSLAIGNGAVANVNQSISIGYNAGVNTTEDYKERNGSLVAIGTSAGNNVKGMQNVAIGASAGSAVLSSNNIAIGTNAGNGIKNVTSETDTNPQNGYNISIGAGANYTEGNTNQNIVSSIAIGHATHAVNRAVAIGEGASAQGDSGMALGNSAKSSGSGSIAIGNAASAADGNIAFGAGAIASGSPSGNAKWTSQEAPKYYISVGNPGGGSTDSPMLRRISNVADGSDDHDVATVAQLQEVSNQLKNTIVGTDSDNKDVQTYSTTYIDNKVTELKNNISASKTKYFSVNPSSQTTNSGGTGANTDGAADAMAIGPNAKASSVKALAIGNNVSASGTLSIAIGTASDPSTDTTTAETPHPTSSEGTSSVAIGTSAIAQTNDSIAIGTRAATYTANTTSTPVSTVGVQSIAIGFSAETRDDNAISIGTKSKANSADAVAIGDEAEALNTNAVVIGKASTAEGSDSVTIGMSNANNGKAVITTGNSNRITNSQGVKDTVQNSGLYGSSNAISSVSSSNTSNAITDVYAVGNSNTLNQNGEKNVLTDVSIMGNKNTIENGTAGAYTQTVKQIAVVGSGNKVKGNTQIDYNTWGTVQRDTILGYKNTVDATTQWTPVSNLQILGNDVTATLGNSVYLGTGSSATASKSATTEAITLAKEQGDAEAIASDEYKKATTEAEQTAIKQKYEAQYIHAANIAAMDQDGISAGITNYDKDYTYGNDSAYTYAGSQATGVVTVGSKDATRRIQNVSAGLVGPNSTDAVNGSQLYALTRQIRFGGDNSTFGKTTAADDVNVVAKGSNEKLAITGGAEGVSNTTTTDGKSVTTVDGTKIADKNIAVIAEDDALHVKLASNLKNLNTAQLGKTTATTTTTDDGTSTTTYSYQETLKLDGTGDNGGTLALKDAKGENGVTLRTSGATKTADVTGAETNRLLVNDKTVATTDDGLKFGGDTGTDSALKLNSKLTVKGGATTGLSDNNNIGVVSDGKGTLTVKLNKDVNLGADGSLTTGTVTAATVTTGSSTLNTNGLTITGGPKFTSNGISANSQQIKNVLAGTDDTDAANYSQIKKATTTVVKGTNVDSVSDDTTSADGHHIYTVNVSNLGVKVADGQKTSVALSDGLVFGNGTNTTASVGQNGAITFNVSNDAIKTQAKDAINMSAGSNVKVDTATSTDGSSKTFTISATHNALKSATLTSKSNDVSTLTITGNDGDTASVDIKNTHLTVTKDSEAKTVTFTSNDGTTPATTLSLSDLGAASTADMNAAKAAASTEVKAGTNASLGTVETNQTDQHKIYTVNVDNLGLKQNGTAAGTVTLADGIDFADGTNTSATVSDGKVTFDLKRDVTGIDTVTANNSIQAGNVKVGKQGTDNKNYVTGLDNKNWTVGQTTYEAGRAATEDQLKSVSDKVASGFQVTDGTTSANIGADKKVTFTNGNYTTAKVTQATDGANVQYDINTAQINAGANGTISAPTTDGVATAANVAEAINSAAWNIKANDGTATAIKAGTTVGLKAGNNLTLSQSGTDFTYRLNDELTGIKSLTTVAQDGVTTTLAASGVTIASSGTGNKSVSLTANGLNNGGKQITDVASGGDTDTNAANISDVKRLVQASASGTTETGFNVKGDDATAQKVKLGKQLNVVGGTNKAEELSDNNIGVVTTADAEGNATLTVKLNKDITLDSVTAGNSTLDTNGLTIKEGTTPKVVITNGNVTMGGNVIHNVGDGVAPTDAVNKGQLEALQNQVSGGWNLVEKNSDGTAVTAKIGAGKTVTYTDGTYTKSVITKDDTTGNATVKVDVTTGTFGAGTGDKAGTVTSTANGLATTQDVATAVNNASWTIQDGNHTDNAQQVKAGDTVSLKAGDNLSLEQNGKEFTYKLNQTLTNMNSVTAVDDKQNTAVLNGEGLKVTDAQGNALTQHATEVRLHDANKAADDTTTDVVLNKQGLQNGGHTITGVADGKVVAGSNTDSTTSIGADKTVSFVNGKNSTVTVSGSDSGATVKMDVDTAELAVKDNKAVATGSGVADAQEVAEAINNAAWNVQKAGDTAQQVKAGDTVTFAAGNNMVLTQSGTSFTYGLAPDVNTKSIRLGGSKDTNDSWTGGIFVGKQIGGGANQNEGDYITGLDNTAWDLSKVVENRAATEGQLKAAINQVTIASQSGGFGLRDEKGSTVSQMLGQTVGIIGDTEYEADGKTVKKQGNITTEADSTNAGAVKVKLNKNLDLTEQGSVTIGTTSLTSGQAKVGKVTVNGTDNTVSGLANTSWDEAMAKKDGYNGSTKAATESQLQAVYTQATTTASANEQHIQAGTYDVMTQSDANGKKQNSVTMNIVDGSGNTKGQVVINDVAKASDVGDTDRLSTEVKTKNGGNDQKTSVVEAVNNLNDKVNSRVGDNRYSAVTSKDPVQDGDSSTTAIAKLNNRMTDIYTTSTQHSSVSVDENLTLDSSSKNTSGGTNYQIGLNKEKIDLGNVTIQGNEGSITAKSMKADTFTAGDTVVNKDGIKVGDKSALTGDSLKVGGKTYVDDKGINANGKAIGNVGDGKNDGDAVNVKQVNDLAARQGEAIGQNAAHINQLDRAVNRLDSRINRVGAGAAALAALHPGEYNPDDKVDFAAGFGNYRGASAAAVGMYYHPDETTTMSVGASFGGGENMVNAGITWKMGKDSGHMSTQAATKAVPVQFVAAPTQTQQSSGQAEGTKMPQPVTAVTTTASGQQVPIVAAYLPSVDNSTRAENDELKELLARQTAILERLADQKTAPAQATAPVSGEDLFPDVPENHWAYDFVAKLAQAGALKDCRVEDPANNPMLTRNDFAQILYTALKNGATKNPALNKDGGLNHLANEFRAELKNVKR